MLAHPHDSHLNTMAATLQIHVHEMDVMEFGLLA